MTKEIAAEGDASLQAFATRLRSLLHRRGDIVELSSRSGIPITTIKKWLAAKTEPSRTNLIALSRSMGVSLNWLATGEHGPLYSDLTEAREIVKKLKAEMTEALELSGARKGDIETLAPFLAAARAGVKVREAVAAHRRAAASDDDIEGGEVSLGLIAATRELCWADFANLLAAWEDAQ